MTWNEQENRTSKTGAVNGIVTGLTVLVLISLALVVWGGVVRLTGSGLSIPEWPIVNGTVLPPFTESDWQAVYQTYHNRILKLESVAEPTVEQLRQFQQMFWIEYAHRALAAIAGIVFLTLFVRTFRNRMLRLRIGTGMIVIAAALLTQAILGGLVVKTDIRPELLSLHLGTAFFFIGMLLWTALRAATNEATPRISSKLNTTIWMGLGFLFLQIMSGALVAGTFAGQLYNTWPTMEGYIIPPFAFLFDENIGNFLTNLVRNPLTVQFVHRWLAFLAAGMLTVAVLMSFRYQVSPRGKFALRAIPTLLTLQILLGLANLLFKVPFWFGLAHLVTAVPLFAVTVVAAYETGYTTNALLRGKE